MPKEFCSQDLYEDSSYLQGNVDCNTRPGKQNHTPISVLWRFGQICWSWRTPYLFSKCLKPPLINVFQSTDRGRVKVFFGCEKCFFFLTGIPPGYTRLLFSELCQPSRGAYIRVISIYFLNRSVWWTLVGSQVPIVYSPPSLWCNILDIPIFVSTLLGIPLLGGMVFPCYL